MKKKWPPEDPAPAAAPEAPPGAAGVCGAGAFGATGADEAGVWEPPAMLEAPPCPKVEGVDRIERLPPLARPASS